MEEKQPDPENPDKDLDQGDDLGDWWIPTEVHEQRLLQSLQQGLIRRLPEHELDLFDWDVFRIWESTKSKKFPENLIYITSVRASWHELDGWEPETEHARRVISELRRLNRSRYSQLEDWELIESDLADMQTDTLSPLLSILDDPENILSVLNHLAQKLVKQRGDRGGGKRAAIPDDEARSQFASKIEERRRLWERILKEMRNSDYDEGFPEAVKRFKWFRELSAGSDSNIDDLLKKALQKKKSGGPEFWPFAFALEHARRDCGIPVRSQSTLEKAYKKAKAAKKARTRRETSK